jgi:hypothetical protein
MPFTWKAAIEQLGRIDMHTKLSRVLSAQKLFEQVDALPKIHYHLEKIVRKEGMELNSMLLYLDMMQASATTRDQRDRIDIALSSCRPVVRSGLL